MGCTVVIWSYLTKVWSSWDLCFVSLFLSLHLSHYLTSPINKRIPHISMSPLPSPYAQSWLVTAPGVVVHDWCVFAARGSNCETRVTRENSRTSRGSKVFWWMRGYPEEHLPSLGLKINRKAFSLRNESPPPPLLLLLLWHNGAMLPFMLQSKRV